MLRAKKHNESEDYIMTVGERIRKLRKQNGYSQEKLATYLCMSRQAVAKWEQNICEPNLDCLTAIAKVFKVDLDYLITGEVDDDGISNQIYEKKTVIIKNNSLLQDKKDIIALLVMIISTIAFVGTFIYSVVNPLYYNQTNSFIWWYIIFWVSSGTLFRILVLSSIVGIILSLHFFMKRRTTK